MNWKNEQVSKLETEKILEVARGALEVEGDFVEMGCYKGDTSLLLAEILRDYNKDIVVEDSVENFEEKLSKNGEKISKDSVGARSMRKLWIYDSFEGLPEKTEKDESALGVDFRRGELAATKREVKKRFLRAGLPIPVIKKGWFTDLTREDMPEKVAFAFLDGDLYESIRDSLWQIEGRIVKGGVIIVHDYNNLALPGVRRAVDEWLMDKKITKGIFQSVVILRKMVVV